MKNTKSRENERDDKFHGTPPDRWGTVRVDPERGPGFTGERENPARPYETAPGKLRRTIYRFIAGTAVIVFPVKWNRMENTAKEWGKKKK